MNRRKRSSLKPKPVTATEAVPETVDSTPTVATPEPEVYVRPDQTFPVMRYHATLGDIPLEGRIFKAKLFHSREELIEAGPDWKDNPDKV